MKRSFFALLTMFALTLSLVNFSFADDTKGKKSSGSPEIKRLAASLPNSDGVVLIDMQRLIKDALPQLLSSKVQFLNEINARIDEVKGQIGIDLREFEHLAVGVMFKENAPKKITYEPVVLARGKMNVGALLAAAKLAAKGKYREEKAGVSTIYVFSAKEILRDNKPKTNTPQEEEKFNKMLARIPAEIAAAALDDNTLAVGLPARVRETVEGKSRVNQNILSLVSRKPNSVISFGANLPPNASQIFNLEDDLIGKNLDAIQQASGTMDVIGVNTVVSIVAKTFRPEQAKDLEDTLSGLQMIGKGFLSAAKGDDKKIYARMVENAKISRVGSEVMLDLQVSNSDLGALLGKK